MGRITMIAGLKPLLFTSSILAVLVMVPVAVKADPIVLTLIPPLQSGTAGSLLTFQGTFANGGDPSVFINSVAFTMVGGPAGFSFDPSDFFAAVPLIVDPGFTVGPVNFFTVSINSAVATGSYSGSFIVLGGAAEDDQNPLATQEFTLQVSPVVAQTPEAATLLLFGSGLCALAAIARRRRRSFWSSSSKD